MSIIWYTQRNYILTNVYICIVPKYLSTFLSQAGFSISPDLCSQRFTIHHVILYSAYIFDTRREQRETTSSQIHVPRWLRGMREKGRGHARIQKHFAIFPLSSSISRTSMYLYGCQSVTRLTRVEPDSRFKAISPTHFATRTKRRKYTKLEGSREREREKTSASGKPAFQAPFFLRTGCYCSYSTPPHYGDDDDDDDLAFQLCNLTNSTYLYSMQRHPRCSYVHCTYSTNAKDLLLSPFLPPTHSNILAPLPSTVSSPVDCFHRYMRECFAQDFFSLFSFLQEYELSSFNREIMQNDVKLAKRRSSVSIATFETFKETFRIKLEHQSDFIAKFMRNLSNWFSSFYEMVDFCNQIR